jgi:rubrerythrin
MGKIHPDILGALTTGIQAEVASYVFYKEASERFDDGFIKETLIKLAMDEKNHFHYLERQYDSLIRSEKWISTADVLKKEGLPEIDKEMHDQHKEMLDQIEQAKSKRKVLEIAYDFEAEAYNLYTGAAQLCDTDEGREAFEFLAKFEKSHMDTVNALIERCDD